LFRLNFGRILDGKVNKREEREDIMLNKIVLIWFMITIFILLSLVFPFKTQENWIKTNQYLVINLSKIPKNATIDEATLSIQRCSSISDCSKNFTLAGCKRMDCNTCCCDPHTCMCTLVYCGYLDKCYYWNYTTREWILNETCVEDFPKGIK